MAKLGKAYKAVNDEATRKDLNEVVMSARRFIDSEKKTKSTKRKVCTEVDELRLREEVAKILIDREWKKRQLKKMSKIYDDRIHKEREEKRKEMKEEESHTARWEKQRRKRVSSWRSFNCRMKEATKRKIVKGVNDPSSKAKYVEDGDRTYIKRVKR